MGFKEKKADIFLRDMADFEVWNYSSGSEQINVASDANTMRVALRTGILKGRTPLLSSFLDVHCYQYGLSRPYHTRSVESSLGRMAKRVTSYPAANASIP